VIRSRFIGAALLFGCGSCLLLSAEDGGGTAEVRAEERSRGLFDLLAPKRSDPAEATPSQAEASSRGSRSDRGGGVFSRLFRSSAKPPAGSAVPAEILASRDALSVEERQALLDFHNQARREVGVAPLAWSPELARFAQEWADEIARSGDFRHRPRSSHRYGENLAMGTAGAYSPVAMARQWYEARSRYRPGTPIRAGSLAGGHYTQMVWRGSSGLGAGIATIQTGPSRGMLVLVCNYDPPGNVVGEAAY